jgi:uncharacterized membrane protein YgcG
MLRRILPALLLLACLALAAPGQARAEIRLDGVDVTIELTREDRIYVTERLQAFADAPNANHGMFRVIPLKPRFRERERRNVSFKVLSASIDGKPCSPDDVKRGDGWAKVYLRDRNAWLDVGPHVFEFTYEMTQQIGFFEGQDELTWNVTSSHQAGRLPVPKASCLVIPPEGAAFTDWRAWIGARGSQESPVDFARTSAKGREAWRFTAKRPVAPNETFTVAVAMPKGTVAAPVPYRPEADWTFTGLCAAAFAAILGLCFFFWYRWGRDPVSGPVAPLFYPPRLPASAIPKDSRRSQFLSAAAASYVMNGCTFGNAGMSALLLQLHAKGHILLSGNEKDGYFIERRQHQGCDAEPLSVEEKEALDRMPAKRFKLDAKGGKRIYKVEKACEDSLDDRFGKMFDNGIMRNSATFALSWLFAVLLWRWHLPEPPRLDDDTMLLLYAGPFVFAIFGAALAPNGTKALRKFSAWIPFLAVLAILPLLGWLGSEEDSLAGMLQALDVLYPASPLQRTLFLGMLAAPFVFAPLMPRPSEDMVQLATQAEGFAMYLRAAESERFNLANQPRHDLALYSRYLPYAVALGEEKSWGMRFAAQLAAVSTAGVAAGTEAGGFFIARPDMLDRFTRDVQTCYSAGAPKSSSSSSSGGSSFSGGGGGAGSGGGGGSWGGC